MRKGHYVRNDAFNQARIAWLLTHEELWRDIQIIIPIGQSRDERSEKALLEIEHSMNQDCVCRTTASQVKFAILEAQQIIGARKA